MASFADFDIFARRRFSGVFFGPNTVSGLPYDESLHQYRREYIRPRSWTITLDAKRGLVSSQGIALALKPPFDERIPTSSDDFFDLVTAPPEPAPGGGGPPLRLPDNFVAYEWTIVEEHGDFRDQEVVALPIHPTWIKVVDLPREGAYVITLRATFTDQPAAEVKVRYVLRDFLIASMGESLAAGQGNPDLPGSVREIPGPGAGGFVSQCDATTLSQVLSNGIDLGVLGSPSLSVAMQRDPIWLESKAERSLRSGHAQAAASVQRQSRREDGTVVDDLITFVSFARSGADIFSGLLGPQGGDDDFIGVGQTEEMRRTADGRAIDALVMSIGGNDSGFAGVLTDLVLKDFSIWRIGKDAEGRAEVVRRVERRLGVGLPAGDRGEVEVRFDALGNELSVLREQIPIRDIYITTYPTGLFEARDDQGQITTRICEIFDGPDLDITNADVREIGRMGGLLNELIRRKAQQFGWHLIDIEATGDFRGRGYCARSERCWVHAEESCNRQGNFNGTMHPNARGHAIYGFHLADRLRRLTIGRRPIEPKPEVITPGENDEFA